MTGIKSIRILVPTDFSETAGRALRYASDLAGGLGGSLVVVHANPFVPPLDFTMTLAGWDETTFELLEKLAKDQLQNEAAANIDPSVPHETVLRVAPAIDGILSETEESGAELVVMGTHGRTGFRRAAIGSVAEAVMRRSKVPVIAVPAAGALKSSPRTIVCPVIYDEPCLAALLFAAQVAPADARFILVRATPAEHRPREADDYSELRASAPEAIAARCELRMLGSEHVATQIGNLATSAGADLIVVTEPIGQSVADILYGTFAERLVQHATCPVLTVNAHATLGTARVIPPPVRAAAVPAKQ